MFRLSVAFALVLTACGVDYTSADSESNPESSTECLTRCFKSFRSQTPINCNSARKNYELLERLLTEEVVEDVPVTFEGRSAKPTGKIEISKVFSSREELCRSLKDVDVWVYDADLIPGTTRIGEYSFNRIGLAASGSLLHEILHHVDASRLGILSFYHYGWDNSGFDTRSNLYHRLSIQLKPDEVIEL